MLHAIAALTLAVMLTVRFKKTIAWTLPLTVCLAMPVLLALAMARRLSWVDGVAVFVLCVAALWLLRTAVRGSLSFQAVWAHCQQFILTPTLLIFTLLTVFWLYACQNRVPLNMDEFHYWATQVRSLYVSDGLVSGARTCVAGYGSYPPGMQLVEWCYQHAAGGWHEGLLYTACFLTNSLFLLPLTDAIPWKKWWLAPLFALGVVVIPTVFTGSAYAMLATDTTLGVVFGALLFTVWRGRDSRRRFETLMISALTVALVLTKNTGIFWAAGGLIFALCLWRRATKPQKVKQLLLAMIPPVCALVAWQVFCAANGLTSVNTGTMLGALRALAADPGALANGTLAVWRGTVKMLLLVPANQSLGWDAMRPLLGLSYAAWVALFSLLAWLGGKRGMLPQPAAQRYAWFLLAFAAAYALLFMLSIPTVFAAEASRWATRRDALLDAVDRYFLPVYYGAAYMGVALLPCAYANSGRRLRFFALTGVLTLTLLCANWQTLACLTPTGYAARFDTDNGSAWMRQNLPWYSALQNPGDCRVLTPESFPSSFGYALAPLSFVTCAADAGDTAPYAFVEKRIDQTAATHVLVLSGTQQNATLLEAAFQMQLQPDVLYRIDTATHPYALVPETGAP